MANSLFNMSFEKEVYLSGTYWKFKRGWKEVTPKDKLRKYREPLNKI